MCQSVLIEKPLAVEIQVQVDYVRCEECGEDLEFRLESDSYGDLQITVERCTCGDIGAGE